MTHIQGIDDPAYVNKQYKECSNLNTRIKLHQKFSTNKYGWQKWLFDQIKFSQQCRILELGCGTGALWIENLERIPQGLDITLSDLSEGMVDQTKKNLGKISSIFKFEVINALSIPYDDSFFDIVIASHMLYHVPDLSKALSEIKRVIKPSGLFYASTIGSTHLKEISELINKFDHKLTNWGNFPTYSFILENGEAQLKDFFSNVILNRYIDSLVVTEVDPLIEYIFSGRLKLSERQRGDLVNFIQRELSEKSGELVVTKESGLFIASNM